MKHLANGLIAVVALGTIWAATYDSSGGKSKAEITAEAKQRDRELSDFYRDQTAASAKDRDEELIVITTPSSTNCRPSDFKVTIKEWHWNKYDVLDGLATVESTCPSGGFSVQIVGYDAKGEPVTSTQPGLWPFSINNIGAGKHVFPLTHMLKRDPRVKTMTITVVEVKTW